MAECEKCGKTFRYHGPTSEKSRFIRIELRDERTHGRQAVVHYCPQHAPFGNTKIPDHLDL